ncbi:MAG: hypothetical protein Q9224_005944, partial [Gallowayella concinna]
MTADPSLRRRLLRDIAELQSKPYPGITLHVHDTLERACLILTPSGYKTLHLTMLLDGYPLKAPRVTIESSVSHPNVFGHYICASILNTQEGYTPAYTLKSIAIQLLSFFSSHSVEQENGRKVDLSIYRGVNARDKGFYCDACGFDDRPMHVRWAWTQTQQKEAIKAHRLKLAGVTRCIDDITAEPSTKLLKTSPPAMVLDLPEPKAFKSMGIKLTDLPDEILLAIFSLLSTTDLAVISAAFPRACEMLNSYDLIRLRELQCFCLKESFSKVDLGVGVSVGRYGREGTLSSEFDLLSHQAFHQHGVRLSIQNLRFDYWLPLPISPGHYRRVQADTIQSLNDLATAGRFTDSSHFSVLSHFLNDIVVSFSQEAERSDTRSTLSHASEKAVESYFAIYHLLLCLAANNPSMITTANLKVSRFLAGATHKTTCPNLGHLLIATLLSDHGLTEPLSIAIIRETVCRNVVWMLDPQGANMPELSYLEPSPVSEYRLKQTFMASRTSYRLLMFCHLFCRNARGGISTSTTHPKPSIQQLRDDLFDTHGAPPAGIAQSMAETIRQIKSIDAFPMFMEAMGIAKGNRPGKHEFSVFLSNM